MLKNKRVFPLKTNDAFRLPAFLPQKISKLILSLQQKPSNGVLLREITIIAGLFFLIVDALKKKEAFNPLCCINIIVGKKSSGLFLSP